MPHRHTLIPKWLQEPTDTSKFTHNSNTPILNAHIGNANVYSNADLANLRYQLNTAHKSAPLQAVQVQGNYHLNEGPISASIAGNTDLDRNRYGLTARATTQLPLAGLSATIMRSEQNGKYMPRIVTDTQQLGYHHDDLNAYASQSKTQVGPYSTHHDYNYGLSYQNALGLKNVAVSAHRSNHDQGINLDYSKHRQYTSGFVTPNRQPSGFSAGLGLDKDNQRPNIDYSAYVNYGF